MKELPILFDRSAVEDLEKCPRKWYWRRAFDGIGLERADLNLAAEIGTAFHEGAEALLLGRGVEAAVLAGTSSLFAAYAADPLDMSVASPQQVYDRDEGLALAEALVRAWAISRLPRVAAFGELIAIEREMKVSFEVAGRTLTLQARPDIVQRRHTDRAVFIRNLKTCSEAGSTWREQWKLDMQTLSEVLAVEAAIGEPVSGVIIEGAIKGRRLDYPMGSGNYYQNSPLTEAWHNPGKPPVEPEDWAARYEWSDSEGTHRLGRGYRKRPVWKSYPGGVAAWIAQLDHDYPQTLDDQFIQLDPILRSAYDIERWRRQVLPTYMVAVAQAESAGRIPDPLQLDRFLDAAFPMHTASGNCLRPGRCFAYRLCHESVADPYEAGFRRRTPHHPVAEEGS